MKIGICEECPLHKEPQWVRPASLGMVKKRAVVVVLESPSYTDIEGKTICSSREDAVIANIINKVFRKHSISYIHSVECLPEKEPSAKSIKCCNGRLFGKLKLINPEIIIPIGIKSCAAMGIKGKITDLRGSEVLLKVPYKDERIVALPTYGALPIYSNPGKSELFKNDLEKGLAILENTFSKISIEDIKKNLILPKTVEDVKKVCKEILEYRIKGRPPVIAVDTETNTLNIWAPHAKITIISFGWDDTKSTAIILDHEEAPYDPVEVRPFVKEVLESQNLKVMHNGKFDLKVISNLLKVEIVNFNWDTMLGEYLLNEDIKGHYGLKVLVKQYMPSLDGYEDELQKEVDREADSRNTFTFTHLDKQDCLEDNRLEYKKVAKALVPGKKEGSYVTRTKSEWVPISTSLKDIKKVLYRKTKRCKVCREKISIKEIKADKNYENVNVDLLQEYAALDTLATRQIFKKQYKKLGTYEKQSLQVMENIIIPASKVLSKMEYRGIQIDKKYLNEIVDKMKDERKKTLLNIQSLSSTISPNKPASIKKFFYDTLMIPIKEEYSTEKGDPSVDEDACKYIAKELEIRGHSKYINLLKYILIYKKYCKAIDTYLLPIDKSSDIDGCVHASFNINGTVTGRLSCIHPNLQNLPKKMAKKGFMEFLGDVYYFNPSIKKVFIPRPGYLLVNMDYSSAEIMVATAYAPDPNLIRIIREGLDMHLYICSKVYGETLRDEYKKLEQVEKIYGPELATDEDTLYQQLHFMHDENKPVLHGMITIIDYYRSLSKATTFGILYGTTAYGLALRLDVSIQEAQKLIDDFFREFPEFLNYIEQVKYEVNKYGKVSTLLGRTRHFPLAEMDFKSKCKAYREAVNFKIQSTSSDLVLLQMCEMEEVIWEKLKGRILLTVHDSIVLEIPKDEVPNLKPFLDEYATRRIREKHPWLPVDLKYDVKIGDNYGSI